MLLLCSGSAVAQSTLDDVALFRSFNQDARVAGASYVHGSLYIASFPISTQRYFGAGLGWVPSPRWELAVALSYLSSPGGAFVPSNSGLTDPFVYAKYNFMAGATRLSAGAFASMPVGSQAVAEGDLDAGVYLAVRHPLGEKTAVAGKVSADYPPLEKEDRDPSVRLSGGVIRKVADKIALLGEVLLNTNGGTTVDFSGGADFAVGPRSRIRGAAGFGLSDRSPDRTILISFLHSFRP